MRVSKNDNSFVQKNFLKNVQKTKISYMRIFLNVKLVNMSDYYSYT